jgi:hypothetical protein
MAATKVGSLVADGKWGVARTAPRVSVRASAPDAFGGARHYESVTCHDTSFVQTITACIMQQVT